MARLSMGTRSGRAAAEEARRKFNTRSPSDGLKGPDSDSELSSVPSDLSDDDGSFGQAAPVNRRVSNAGRNDLQAVISQHFGTPSSALGKRRRGAGGDVSFAKESTPMPSAATQEARKRLRSAPSVKKLIASLAYGGSAEASSSRARDGSAGSAGQEREEGSPDAATPFKGRRRSIKEPVSRIGRDRSMAETGEGEEQGVEEARRASASSRKGKQRAKVAVREPPNWREIYDLVREMRKNVPAPVDTMGCERLAEDDVEPHVNSLSSHLLRSVELLLTLSRSDVFKHWYHSCCPLRQKTQSPL